jgi:hypothetical protein
VIYLFAKCFQVPNKAPKEVKKSGVRFAAEPEMEEIETATEVRTFLHVLITFNEDVFSNLVCVL